MDRSIQVLATLFLSLLVLGPLHLQAQDKVPETELKDRFFQRLNRPQIITLMEGLDQSQQLTSFELGAKYRWGEVPPDRRPPVRLAQWWRSLTPRQKTNERVKWFRKHYQELNLDRAARELKMQDELTQIYRQLREKYSKEPGKLESVPFPGGSAEPPTKSGNDTDYTAVYDQNKESGEPDTSRADSGTTSGKESPRQTDESSRSPDSTSGQSAPSDNGSASTDQRAEEPPGKTEPSRESSTGSEPDTSDNRKNTSAASTGNDAGNGDTITRQFGDGSVMYRRVGDHIEIVGEDEKRESDLSGQELPVSGSSSSDGNESTTRNEESSGGVPSPSLNRRNESSASKPLTIPSPSIRRLQSDIPEIRR